MAKPCRRCGYYNNPLSRADLRVGMTVWWNDPNSDDPESDCSGIGIIEAIDGDGEEALISLSMRDGGFRIEAYPSELEHAGWEV